VEVIRWLLEKGVPWSASQTGDDDAEVLARKAGKEEARKVLREWAVNQGERHSFLDQYRTIMPKMTLILPQNTSCTTEKPEEKNTPTKANLLESAVWIRKDTTTSSACPRSFIATQMERQRTKSPCYASQMALVS
jgi:hypothetical protein